MIFVVLLIMIFIPILRNFLSQNEKEKCINMIKKDEGGYTPLHKLIMMLTNEKDKKLSLKEIVNNTN